MDMVSALIMPARKKRAAHTLTLDELGDVQLRATRRNVATFGKLFPLGRGHWSTAQAAAIRKYGDCDTNQQHTLKGTVSVKLNPQGLKLTATNASLQLRDRKGKIIASWHFDALMQRFAQKLPSLILVIADTRLDQKGGEEFHYTHAYLLNNPSK